MLWSTFRTKFVSDPLYSGVCKTKKMLTCLCTTWNLAWNPTTLYHRLQVSAPCSGVPSGVVRACQTVRVVVTCAQLLAVICKSSQLVLLLVALAALLYVPPSSGTAF